MFKSTVGENFRTYVATGISVSVVESQGGCLYTNDTEQIAFIKGSYIFL